MFTLFGAGLLGLAHTWPAVNKWTHGTLITAMHGHAAFYGAYAMIVLAMITYALPALTPGAASSGTAVGYWAFWLQLAGMFGMTLSFATAGIGQVYLERILGLGYLETQLKIQVHFLMLIVTGSIFALGVALFICDFFRHAPTASRTGEPVGRADAPRAGTAVSRAAGATCRAPARAVLPAAGDEVAIFEQCHAPGLPVMLKGPTGCGKTRFVEHMAWRLERPLVTISCHDDLTASDLVGRFLIRDDGTVWQDGPLTRAVREGAICYLDEVVEARRTRSSCCIR